MPNAFLRVWAWPLMLAALTTSGLISALVSDGWGDAWAWLGLGAPIAASIWFALIRPLYLIES